MVIDLIIKHDDDGFTAEVPSLKGCESWAHTEDEAIDKAVELVRYYVRLPDSEKMLVDRARKLQDRTVYKLVFNK